MNWCLCACIFHRVLKMILIWYLILNLSKNSLLDPVLSISTIRKKKQSENFVSLTLNQVGDLSCFIIHSGILLYDLVCLKKSEPLHTICLHNKSPKQSRGCYGQIHNWFQVWNRNSVLVIIGPDAHHLSRNLHSAILTINIVWQSTLRLHHVEKSQIGSFLFA